MILINLDGLVKSPESLEDVHGNSTNYEAEPSVFVAFYETDNLDELITTRQSHNWAMQNHVDTKLGTLVSWLLAKPTISAVSRFSSWDISTINL